MSQNTAPIGLFDSGLGGLTVFRALRKALPHESLLYLGDTARVPYGSKSVETVTRYSLENATFLSERGVKALVVACNTASAFALETLSKHYSIPVVGVIVPGVEQALEMSRTKRIGVVGTTGTINSQAYAKAIKVRCPEAQVISRPCPLFVPLVEEGWLEDPVTDAVIRRYLEPLEQEKIDTLILGCTHYPLLSERIQEILGPQIQIVNSAEAVADALCRHLHDQAGHGGPPLRDGSATPTYHLYVTDHAPQFTEVARRILRDELPPVTTVAL